MAVRPIRMFGDPVLRTPAAPVTSFDAALRALVVDLVDTMLDAPGAGLAAPQIGVGQRVFVYQADGEVAHLVNPRLELSPEREVDHEGCLSIPVGSFEVARSARVLARGLDQDGAELTVHAEGRLARALQHETDHVDGVLFLDHLSREDRREAMRRLRLAADAADSGASTAVPARGR